MLSVIGSMTHDGAQNITTFTLRYLTLSHPLVLMKIHLMINYAMCHMGRLGTQAYYSNELSVSKHIRFWARMTLALMAHSAYNVYPGLWAFIALRSVNRSE
jgi:hypothetical protein